MKIDRHFRPGYGRPALQLLWTDGIFLRLFIPTTLARAGFEQLTRTEMGALLRILSIRLSHFEHHRKIIRMD